VKNPYDQYVNNAINSQGNITNVGESSDKVHHRAEVAATFGEERVETIEQDVTIKKETQVDRQFEWSKADDIPPVDDPRSSQILEEVGRMEVWMKSVADKVHNVKSQMQDLEEEATGSVLNLKDP
jgi:hypothetical protein